jgi:hypothetical protein
MLSLGIALLVLLCVGCSSMAPYQLAEERNQILKQESIFGTGDLFSLLLKIFGFYDQEG